MISRNMNVKKPNFFFPGKVKMWKKEKCSLRFVNEKRFSRKSGKRVLGNLSALYNSGMLIYEFGSIEPSGFLKGAWHEIFDFWFFHISTPPRPLIHGFLNMALSTMKSPIFVTSGTMTPLCKKRAWRSCLMKKTRGRKSLTQSIEHFFSSYFKIYHVVHLPWALGLNNFEPLGHARLYSNCSMCEMLCFTFGMAVAKSSLSTSSRCVGKA
jgi:hypothetical protein